MTNRRQAARKLMRATGQTYQQALKTVLEGQDPRAEEDHKPAPLGLSLADLVDRRSCSQQLADYLKEAVLDKKNIVVSGPKGSGKSTVLRALACEIPKHERLPDRGPRIGTIESRRELRLDEDPKVFDRVAAWEASESVTVGELIATAWRFNVGRLIVGEIQGEEAVDLCSAARGGGVMTTLNARTAEQAASRMIDLSIGATLTQETASKTVGEQIDLIVQLGRTRSREDPAERHRHIDSVVSVTTKDDGKVALAVVL